MIAARTRIAALVVVFFALTSILWGSTAAHATDGLSISGTVYLGTTDTPATTGTVEVEYTIAGETHDSADVVPVNADGTWTITGVSSGSYLIYYHYIGSGAYLSKYQSQQSTITYPFADQATVVADTDVTGLGDILELPGTISGHVTVGTSTVPATASQVSVTASVYAGSSGATGEYTTLPAVQTDASGAYTITGVAPGDHWRLLFTYEGTGSVQSVYYGQVMDDAGEDFTVASGAAVVKDQTLPNRMSISGHVYLGTTATTAGGGDVTLQLREYDNGVLNTTPILTTTTAVGGGYSFTGLDNRQFQVTPVYSGSGAYSDGDPLVFTATTTTADFTLAASGSTTTYALTGHVDIGSDGNSAQANEIYVGLLTADQETLVTTTLTDASGNYSFPGLVAGSYHVVYANYAHPNQDSWPVYSLAQVGPGLTAPSITFPVYNISGHVNLAGTTAAGAGDVTIRASNGAGFVATTSTDSSGHYTFSLPEGKYSIGFRFAGDTADDVQTTVTTYSDLRQLDNSDQTVPTPALTAYDWISGAVSLPSGTAATAVTVYADRYDTDGNFVDEHVATVATGTGTYSFTKLPLGTYDVSFYPADGSTLARQQWSDKSIYDVPTDLDGTTGAVFTNINAAMHAGGTVSGSVLGAPDYANNDVFVEVLSFDQANGGSYDETGDFYTVGVDGTYSITGLLPGSYVIEASYSGPAGNVTVDSGAVAVSATTPQTVDIQLAPGAATGSPRGSLDSATTGPGTITVSGWALDQDTLASIQVHVYVDGAYQGQVQATQTRTDIGDAFPGFGSNHGFTFTLVGVPGGTHTVCAYGINQGPTAPNTTLGCKTVTVAAANPIGSLDAVTSTGPGAVSLSGWALDFVATAPLAVHVYVDGVFNSVLSATGERSDVGSAYPGTGTEHGYTAALTGLAAGTHSVCTYGINQGTGSNALLGCRSITVLGGSPIGSFDSATVTGPGSVALSGWAIDPDAADSISVHVYVDGVYNSAVSPVTADGARPDLAAAFVGYGANHGFAATLTGLTGGKHTICVYGINELAGSNSTVGCKTITVPTGGPVGSLDTATGVTGGISLSGWVLDPDTAASTSVDVYVDNAYNESVTAAVSRTDIATAFPGYGAAHGFTTTADATPGSHTVCVYGINAASTPGSNALLRCTTVVVPTVPAG